MFKGKVQCSGLLLATRHFKKSLNNCDWQLCKFPPPQKILDRCLFNDQRRVPHCRAQENKITMPHRVTAGKIIYF